MKKEVIQNEKTCKKCRYYSQHYAKSRSEYIPVGCGHCLNRNIKVNKKRDWNVCELWEDISIKKAETKKCITETLEFMAKRINEIAMLLHDDE